MFDRYQLGTGKAKALAKNVQFANPAVEALSSPANVVDLLQVADRRQDIVAADVIINATASTTVATVLERQFRDLPKKHPPIISMALGHKADQALLTMAVEGVAGVTLDIDRRAKIAFSNIEHGRFVLDEFWPTSADRMRLFQPELGCSSPTFRGSSADVLALTAKMTNAAARWLADTSLAASRVRSFDIAERQGGRSCEFEFEWPADLVLRDGREWLPNPPQPICVQTNASLDAPDRAGARAAGGDGWDPVWPYGVPEDHLGR